MNQLAESATIRNVIPGHMPVQGLGGSNIRRNPNLLRKISASLESGKCVVLFYFDIARFHEIENGAGMDIAERIINLFKDTLAHGMLILYQRQVRILAAESLWGDDFILITEADRAPTLGTLENLAIAYRKQIKDAMNKEFRMLTGRDMDTHIGYAVITDKRSNAELMLYNATKKAYAIAKGFINMQSVRYLPEFKRLLEEGGFHSVYQPIISIRSAAVLGWEALVRGPEDSYFRRPDVIFSFAEEEGLLSSLEKVCRESALNNLGEIGPDQKVFINIHPKTVNDPHFVEEETLTMIGKLGMKPKNIVFEITERHHITDFDALNRTLANYRDQGFLVALDDVGAGFSSLQSIAEIRPDYIKIDMSLVRSIHKDRVKTALMETFVAFSEKIGCEIIAEGVEEEAELAALANIGVHYGQGYFFGKPSWPKQVSPHETYLKTLHFVNNGRFRILKHAFPIGDIIDEATWIGEQMPVKDVINLFDADSALAGVVVVEDRKPCGLIMRQHLDRHLGRKYGVALYYEKPISRIMDKLPLIVDCTTPVELVSQAAMSRNKLKLYDNIIVTRNGLLHGFVSVQTLLDTMTRIRVELAKGANPLTGLPGNIAIEQEHSRRAALGRPFSIIFIDLDYFKSYNDKYGFEKGDEVILYTAGLLKGSLEEHGGEDDFLSHIGGDDFLIFTTDERVDPICTHVIENFDAHIRSLYSAEDREAGGVYAQDRSGGAKLFPFISISMAVLDCTAETGKDMKEIAAKVAQLKQFAKSQHGSVYVRDRRRD